MIWWMLISPFLSNFTYTYFALKYKLPVIFIKTVILSRLLSRLSLINLNVTHPYSKTELLQTSHLIIKIKRV